MGLFGVLTLSLSVLFIDANTDAMRKAVDTQERGDATP